MNINELNRIKMVNIEEKLAGVERGTGTFKEILDNVMSGVIIPLTDNSGNIVGMNFDTKVANLIEDLRSGDLLQEEREAALFSLNDNFQYMKRFISSVGADFSLAKLKPVEVGVNEFINSYLKSWGNFGKNAFSLKYIPGVLDDTTFVVDETLFRILFDTLLDNAYRHGFNKLESPTNRVAISTSCVSMHDREYVLIEVANNGVPFSEGFSLKKFISRGTKRSTKSLCFGSDVLRAANCHLHTHLLQPYSSKPNLTSVIYCCVNGC